MELLSTNAELIDVLNNYKLFKVLLVIEEGLNSYYDLSLVNLLEVNCHNYDSVIINCKLDYSSQQKIITNALSDNVGLVVFVGKFYYKYNLPKFTSSVVVLNEPNFGVLTSNANYIFADEQVLTNCSNKCFANCYGLLLGQVFNVFEALQSGNYSNNLNEFCLLLNNVLLMPVKVFNSKLGKTLVVKTIIKLIKISCDNKIFNVVTGFLCNGFSSVFGNGLINTSSYFGLCAGEANALGALYGFLFFNNYYSHDILPKNFNISALKIYLNVERISRNFSLELKGDFNKLCNIILSEKNLNLSLNLKQKFYSLLKVFLLGLKKFRSLYFDNGTSLLKYLSLKSIADASTYSIIKNNLSINQIACVGLLNNIL